MNWGKWIVVAFVLFAAFIGTLVTVCVRQDISLVSKEYYKEELEFEKQIARVKNVTQLQKKPEIVVNQGTVQVVFDRFQEMENGKLTLFRPSDSAKDKTFELVQTLAHIQTYSTIALMPGMYRAKLEWSMNGKEFYLEEIVYL
jgi:hypothetical protein